MWGIIPAAGAGSRIQPLAFSKELLPVGSRVEEGVERPKAVSEYLVERMIEAGATKICFVISPGKSDIMEYYGGSIGGAHVSYVVQPRPAGLCDSIFRALPLIPQGEYALAGLPDTVWFPRRGFSLLGSDPLSFLLFPVERPESFDAVSIDSNGAVLKVEVKSGRPSTNWVWGAFKLKSETLSSLHALWTERGMTDEYLGTLVNEYILRGGTAVGVRKGESYVDVGTLNGYREAIRLLGTRTEET